jgi:tetratricopeptide (TPR) repeat protein
MAPLCLLILACQTAPGAKPAASIAQPKQTAGLNPIERYKEQRMADAMRGLDYATGRVVIDEKIAAEIAQRGTMEEALLEARRGTELLTTNHFEESISAFTRAVIIAPEAPEMYQGLAGALVFKGRTEETEAALRTAIDLNAAYIDAWFDLAHVLQLQGRFEEAIDAWYEVLALDADHADAHYRLALAQYYTNHYADSWTHVHRAEDLGLSMPPQFRPLLEHKMSEPQG